MGGQKTGTQLMVRAQFHGSGITNRECVYRRRTKIE